MEEVKYIQGDLVRIKPSVFDEECDEVFQIVVSSREGTFVLCNVRNTNEMFAVQEEQINPIILTPAILEANGWKTQNNWYYFLDINKGFFSNIGIDFKYKSQNGNLYVEVNGKNMAEIQYCHQLQHLLFGLGLDSSLKV